MKITKNFFIFEGLDGSGKTTQAKMLFDYLSHLDTNQSVHLFREPGGTVETEIIRDVLKGSTNLDNKQQLLLFCLSRRLLLERIDGILQEEPNAIFIFDRFLPSTYAYQHVANGIDALTYTRYTQIANKAFDVQNNSCNFYIRITPETCMERIESRGEAKDRYENLDYLKKVFSGYEKYYMEVPNKDNHIVDGNPSIDEIQQHIKDIVKDYIQE